MWYNYINEIRILRSIVFLMSEEANHFEKLQGGLFLPMREEDRN